MSVHTKNNTDMTEYDKYLERQVDEYYGSDDDYTDEELQEMEDEADYDEYLWTEKFEAEREEMLLRRGHGDE